MMNNDERQERIIGSLLWYGTWIASAIIAVGVLMGKTATIFFGLSVSGYDIMKAGVALFIMLPIARVAVTFIIFLRERDYAFTLLSSLVLMIIGVGIFANMLVAS